MTHDRPRTCSNPAPGLMLILAALAGWLFVFGAWAVLSAVVHAILGGVS